MGFVLFWSVLLSVVATQSKTIVSISDIHLDPYFGQSLQACTVPHAPDQAVYGCDAPLSLVQSALQAAATVLPCPDLIITTGDLVRHHLSALPDPSAAMDNTTAAVQQAFQTVFGHCQNPWSSSPLWTLGNNDLYPKYSLPQAPNPWLANLAAHWTSLTTLPSAEKNSYINSGFFTVQPWPQLRIIVLHTNYWARQCDTAQQTDPAGGFAYLQSALTDAETSGEKVWLMGHIPPGVDHYGGKYNWHPNHQLRFQNIVKPYIENGLITNMLFGHEHVIMNRGILANGTFQAFMHGAVSPVYFNNPSVRVYSSNDTTIQDFTDYFVDLHADPLAWENVYGINTNNTFKETFKLRDFSDVNQLSANLKSSPILLGKYSNNTVARYQPFPCDNSCQTGLWCDLTNVYPANYTACTSS